MINNSNINIMKYPLNGESFSFHFYCPFFSLSSYFFFLEHKIISLTVPDGEIDDEARSDDG